MSGLVAALLVRPEPEIARVKTFIEGRTYKRGDKVVGKLLVDDDYRRMVEDLKYRGVTFDWAWAKATGGKPNKPERLEFDVRTYGSVWIAPVTNPSMKIAPGLTEEVHELFADAMRLLGLECSPPRTVRLWGSSWRWSITRPTRPTSSSGSSSLT